MWLEADLQSFRDFVDYANKNSANATQDVLNCKIIRDKEKRSGTELSTLEII